MAISRHWKATAKQGEIQNYLNHLKDDTFPGLSGINGFISARVLTRRVERGTEVVVITEWKSLESIRAFAGEQTDGAVVPAAVQRMMIEWDERAVHYEVIEEYTPQ